MTGFSSRSARVETADGRHVRLLEPLTFTRPEAVGGQVYIIPAGAESDGASIPQFVWSTGLAPFGIWWLACVLHDCAYRVTTRPAVDDRATADLLLWEAMESLGVPASIARTIYTTVRVAGQAAWDADRHPGA